MSFLQYEVILWIVICLALLTVVIHHSLTVSSQDAAHDKIIRSWEDIAKILSPYKLQALYVDSNCWTVHDGVYDKTFSLMIPATKFLSLLKQLKHGKITIEDFWSYLRAEEVKYINKLQKSKEL